MEKKLLEELKYCLDTEHCWDCTYRESEATMVCEELFQAAYERIKGYEELEEQCVKENSWCLRMLLYKWKEFIEEIQELYKYRKLKKQRKLIVLPCAVGDMVYVIEADEENFEHFRCGMKISEHQFDYWMIPIFEKCVFLTKEQAEAALKEMEGNNGNTEHTAD